MEDKYGTPAINLPEEDEEEIWMPAPGYEDRYEISSFGNLKNKKTGLLRKLDKDHFGYPVVCLRKYDPIIKKYRTHSVYIHRLVCEAFNGPPTAENNICDHIDRCIVNNYYLNLRWTDHRGNKMNSKTSSARRPHIKIKTTPIVLLDINGNFIERFNSILEAHEKTGISIQQIQHNLRGAREPFKIGYFKTEADYFDK